MGHVVSKPTAPFAIAGGRLEVHQIPAWHDNFVWLLVNPASGEAAAVDGPEAAPVLGHCEQNGLRLTTIINTHTHPDHVGLNRDLASRGLLEGLRVVGGRKRGADVPGLNEPVEDGDTIRFGQVEATVLLTEGHIDGHLSFVFDDALFCGDTLFGAGCGYLFDGPAAKMHDSLQRLAALDPATRICCAHEYTEDNLRFAWSVEPENADLASRIRQVWKQRSLGQSSLPSTVGEERRTNPFLRGDSEALRAHVAEQLADWPMKTGVERFAATRALKDRKDYRRDGDERLPLVNFGQVNFGDK